MDICTITQFRDSLNSPETLLRTQHNIIFEPETLCCSKHFAEARATIDGRSVMLYAPITLQAANMARQAKRLIMATNAKMGDMQILDKEILYSGLLSGKCCMLMESIPSGTPLSEAIYTHSRTHLLMGLNKLKARLKHHDLSHNYLNIYNIIVDKDHTWHTIRNYHVTQGYGEDITMLKELERHIKTTALPDCDYTSVMQQEQLLLNSIVSDNHGIILHPIKESRRRFVTPNGVGFQDRHGTIIIQDIYSWASDFEEERAVVRLKSGKMGVIDRKGNYIIEPLYDNIEYNSYTGISVANNGEQQTKFDYMGEVISK
ncbi:MAG: WG repeat-containing protein [Alistipes sp.]|nr:WG repeat-containing protein [Alistipes sp.]